jgi:hypothetical protein
MKGRYDLTNESVIQALDQLLADSEYIDYAGRYKKKKIKKCRSEVKKLKSLLEDHEIELTEELEE